MPILTIDTNQNVDANRSEAFLGKTLDLLANMLEKPKSSIIVRFNPGACMMMGDADQPTAYIELKAFAFQKEKVSAYVKELTQFVQTELGVVPKLQYHELIKLEPSMFGWNGDTC